MIFLQDVMKMQVKAESLDRKLTLRLSGERTLSCFMAGVRE